MLVAQVKHKCGSAVEEGQHPDTDVELRWGRVVSKQAVDSLGGCDVFAGGNVTRILPQTAETQVEPRSFQCVHSPRDEGV